jgi:tRNA(adenine34) deaminase
MHPDHYMQLAIDLATDAGNAGEIPIGAVIVNKSGEVIAQGANSRERDHDPTAHAEIKALRAAGIALNDWRITECTMYVTLEPCPMCAGAITMSRIPRLVIGAWNDEYGAAGSRWDLVRDKRLNHQVEVIQGVMADQCGKIIREFMGNKRH